MAKSLNAIERQISKLQAKKKKIKERESKKLAAIIFKCGAANLSPEILAGALLEAVQAHNDNDSKISIWQKEGQKVLHPGRGRRKIA